MSPPRCPLLFFALTWLVLFAMAAPVVASDDKDISVTVSKHSGTVFVDVSMVVPASQREAWDVLTDYDHMAQFFPNLRSSKVIARKGDTLRLEQKGKLAFGPFSYSFESVREIELQPYQEIHSRAVAGSLKMGTAITRLTTQGANTLIQYHSESVPAVWVPPAIGPRVIASQTRAQFESLRTEILKRKNGAKNMQ